MKLVVKHQVYELRRITPCVIPVRSLLCLTCCTPHTHVQDPECTTAKMVKKEVESVSNGVQKELSNANDEQDHNDNVADTGTQTGTKILLC